MVEGTSFCLLDRNNEIFISLEERCRNDQSSANANTSKSSCSFYSENGGRKALSIFVRLEHLGDVIIDGELKPNAAGARFAGEARFRISFDNICAYDGSTTANLSSPRICEENRDSQKSASVGNFSNPVLRTFRRAVETYLNSPVVAGEVKTENVASEQEFYAKAFELAGIPENLQQIYPTSIVNTYASQIDFNAPLEDIMKQFAGIQSKIPPYQAMPFAIRKKKASDMFVCKRSAHEIAATGFMFGCGEYVSLFQSVLMAGGIETRIVKVVSENFDESKNDSGHDLVEVLDPLSNKWILTDPTAGMVLRQYDGEKYFRLHGQNWIRFGQWESNWDAGCFDKKDLTKMRALAKKNFDPSGKTPADLSKTLSCDE